jgi:hypothetical protein
MEFLSIQVAPDFKSKLVLYTQDSGEQAGQYLERLARRDLDDRVRRIVTAWSFVGPPAPALPEHGLNTPAA